MPVLETLPCPVCNKTSQVEVTAQQYSMLRHPTMLIQSILPDWPDEKRELLITGTHPECWEAIFAGMEDEEDDDLDEE